MSAAASFGRTVLVGAVSAGLAVVASDAVWAVQDAAAPARPVQRVGSDLVPLVVPLTLVALACWGALLVLRRRGRRVVSVLGAAAALTASAVTVTRIVGAEDLNLTAWPWVVAGAAAVTAGALVRAWVAAPGWPEMSSRYDRQAARDAGVGSGADGSAGGEGGRPQAAAELWRALDEGRDPTA